MSAAEAVAPPSPGPATARGDGRAVQLRLIVLASAITAMFGPAAPTGLLVVDIAYRAAVGALVAYAGSRAARWAWVVIAAASLAFAHEWWQIPSTVALVLAVSSVFERRASRRTGALVAGLAVQGLLHQSTYGFHGAPTVYAIAATIPLLISAYHRSPPVVRHRSRVGALIVTAAVVVLGLPFLGSAVLARGPIDDGVAGMEAGLGSAESVPSNPTAELAAASDSIERARSLVGAPWALGARLVPGLAQQQQALSYATEVAGDLTRRTSESAGEPRSPDGQAAPGRIDLEQLEAAGAGSERLDRALASLEPRFRDARLHSAWLAGPTRSLVDDLRGSLRGGDEYVDSTIRAARALPALLGADGPRRYLVVLLDPSTSRGMGGVARAYAHLTADQGTISLDDAGPIERLAGGEAVDLEGPAGYRERYGPYDLEQHVGDVTYSPDVGQVADVLGQIDASATAERPLDGVLLMDPIALQELYQATEADGGVDVGRLRRPGTDDGRDARFAQALEDTVDDVLSSRLPEPVGLSRAITSLADAGRISMHSRHPGDQAYLDATGLSRRLRPPGRDGDVIGVTSQSARADGLDRYLRRRTVVTSNAHPSGSFITDVTVSLENTAPKGTTRQWVTVYNPGDVLGVKADGKFLPVRAVPEAGLMAFSTFVDVPAGGERTLSFGLLARLDPTSRYDLHVFDQPGDARSTTTVNVTTSGGFRVRARVGAKPSGERSVATVPDGGQTDITVLYGPTNGRR